MTCAALLVLALLAPSENGYRRVAKFNVTGLMGTQGKAEVRVEQAPEADIIRAMPGRAIPPPARVCIQPPGACYEARDRHLPTPEFFLNPKATTVDISAAPPLRNAIVFVASQNFGGGGTGVLFSLLTVAPNGQMLVNLTPRLILTNQSEYSFWADSSVAPYKFLSVADPVWSNGESRFSAHRFRISTYAYSVQEAQYLRVDEYTTRVKYPSLDSVSRINVLAPEDAVIRARIREGIR